MPRRYCQYCHKPETTCFCARVVAIDNTTPVVILQHPLERQHPKNTAGLLARCLNQCRVICAERFTAEQIAQLGTPERPPVLLYPSATNSAPQDLTHRSCTLIVLDATWRKSRKMLHLNPALAALPRLALERAQTGRYAIRRAQKPNQLSTMEASCYALQQLEQDEPRYQPALAAFDYYMNDLKGFDPKFTDENQRHL